MTKYYICVQRTLPAKRAYFCYTDAAMIPITYEHIATVDDTSALGAIIRMLQHAKKSVGYPFTDLREMYLSANCSYVWDEMQEKGIAERLRARLSLSAK